jgi:hypothetical protein
MSAEFDLVKESDIAAVVFGRGDAVLLGFLGNSTWTPADTMGALLRGFRVCGFLGFHDGRISRVAENAEDLDAARLLTSALEPFARYVQEAKCGDTLAWLETLAALEDPRP